MLSLAVLDNLCDKKKLKKVCLKSSEVRNCSVESENNVKIAFQREAEEEEEEEPEKFPWKSTFPSARDSRGVGFCDFMG